MPAKTSDDLHGLGANERAILNRIPWRPARRLAASVVRGKMRLQFTGWLQYVLPLPLLLLLTSLALITALLGPAWAVWIFGAPATLLAVGMVFDLITCRWRIRPQERRPEPLDHLDPFDLLRARHSCRSFQTRPMSDEDREALLASVRTHLAVPTIGTAAPRLEYLAAPLTVWPTINASEFLVAIVPKAYDRLAIIDVGRALQRVVMDATRMGIATCWIGPGADQESVIRQLGDRFDPERDHVVCVCAAGYRSAYLPMAIRLFNRKMSSSRLPLSMLFFEDMAMNRSLDPTAAPFAAFGRTFEACQWAPSSYNGQTTRAVLEAEGGQVSAVRFRAVTASRYYAPVGLGIWCANWELGCEALGIEGHFTAATPSEAPIPEWDVVWTPAP